MVIRKTAASAQGSSLDPELQAELMPDGRGFVDSSVLNGAKEGGVRPFGNLDDDRLAAAFSIEILMQLKTQLADMYAD